MITPAEMKAQVDRQIAWMVGPGRPTAQKSFDVDEEPEWAEATFLVGGDEVSVTAEVGEGGRGYVKITVYEPTRSVAFRKVLDFGEDLNERDRQYIESLLIDMGSRVKYPAAPPRGEWPVR